MTSYQEKVQRLVEAVEAMPKPPTPEVGTKVWVPCAGVQAPSHGYNIPKGHVGQILVAKRDDKGKVGWERTGSWLDRESAERQYKGITISSSHGHCPSCYEIVESHR